MDKEKVLIIEDDPQTVRLVTFVLEKENCSVIWAKDGQEGLLVAKKEKPALIILDLMLPGIDGYRVCEMLKNDPETRRVPILVLTALDTGENFEKALEKNVDWYITKPFEGKHLANRVKQLISEARKYG